MERKFEVDAGEGQIDARFKTVQGRIESFAIQLSYEEAGHWVEIYRADTDHGFLHEHRFWESDERIRLEESFEDYNQAFNALFQYIRENAQEWIEKKRRKKYGRAGYG